MTRIHKPLIEKIKIALEDDSRVLAAWLEGSIARGEDDDFSDIDLWISVKDKQFSSFIEEREQFAAKLGTVVSVLYPKTLDQPDEIDSFKILLEDYPTSLSVDVDVQKESRKLRFTKDSSAEELYELFDRGGVIKFKPFNPQEVEEYVQELFEDTITRFWHMLPKIMVLLERNDLLEATDHYLDRLTDLVTLYRIMYSPEKADWGFKDIEYDLEEDVVKKIYSLYPNSKVKSMRKLTQKLARVFHKQSKVLSKRLRIELPKELTELVSNEL